MAENEGPLVRPSLRVAGSDVSRRFDARGEKGAERVVELETRVDPVTNLVRPYRPSGQFLRVPPNDPSVTWDARPTTPWWRDGTSVVGAVSAKLRAVRVKNALTRQEHLSEVPGEEKLGEIRARYAEYNCHAESYAWRVLRRDPEAGGELKFVNVDLDKTLEENGVVDDAKTFEELSIPSDAAIPVIHLYFKDVLTSA